jgi:solute:Na+ symporter, SSS family
MILFIGVIVFVFYLFNQSPVFHNVVLKDRAMKTEKADSIRLFESEYSALYNEKRHAVDGLVNAIHSGDERAVKSSGEVIQELHEKEKGIRSNVKSVISRAVPNAKAKDTDYIFLNFVLNYLPHGIIGLLLAVMFSAAMSSMAGELNALASTTSVDFYKRIFGHVAHAKNDLRASRLFTIGWALLAMVFALLADFSENLIQFVNIVGSLFYGTLLGIFLSAFYIRYVKGTAVFIAGILSELIIFYLYFFTDVAFLIYNLIACAAVIVFAIIIQFALSLKKA